jgi:hypothetical protein
MLLWSTMAALGLLRFASPTLPVQEPVTRTLLACAMSRSLEPTFLTAPAHSRLQYLYRAG